MIGFYAIIKCPKCGNEIPVQYGYSSGFDSTINSRPDVICYNNECSFIFEANFNVENHKIYNVDFKLIDNNLTEIDSYKDYCEQLLNHIKKYCV